MRAAGFIAAALLSIGAPALAQERAAHEQVQPPERTECQKEAERHRAMGHPVPDEQCAPDEHAQMDHGATDHSDMDHAQMDHGGTEHDSMQHALVDHSQMNHDAMNHSGRGTIADIPFGSPPPGSGPARAADAIWGAEAMRESRARLPYELGEQRYYWVQGDRVEYQGRQGSDGYLWDVQGYYGGDTDKLWLKSEGEGDFGQNLEEAEVQALYSRAIGPWFDLQTGVRQDLAPVDRTYAVVGVQGLAPYLFEVDAAAFLSARGDLTARIEGEIDQRITQRLILQPRAEVNLAAQDVPELGIGSGIDSVEAGIRLRYEITREFAPYIGVEQNWKFGGSADYARAAGEDPSVTSFVAGIRFWF